MAKMPRLIGAGTVILLASCCKLLFGQTSEISANFPLKNQPASLVRPLFPKGQQVPEAVSLIVWIEGKPNHEPLTLSTFGESGGAGLTVTANRLGAPIATALTPGRETQVCQAGPAGAKLLDGSIHSLVVVANFSSGLVRMYVDGAPEAASVFTAWRPHWLDQAYVYCPENSFPTAAFGNLSYVSRLIGRELSDEEISHLQPPTQKNLAPLQLAESILSRTLAEFQPPGAEPKRTLRERNP